jgi:hypothetical protein
MKKLNFRKSSAAVALVAAFLFSGLGAQAHGVILPPPKLPNIFLSKALLNSKLLLNNKLLFHNQILSTRIPGLSGSASSLLNFKKSLVNQGINLGAQTSIQKQMGTVLNGQLSGTLYENVGGTAYTAYGPNYILAFGNNPLFNPYPNPQLPAPTTVVSNFIKFAGGGTTTFKGPAGKVVVSGGNPFRIPSGSERAYLNELKSITHSAVGYGATLGNSPIVGGQFFGTNYYSYSSVTSFMRNSSFVYAFGNDPFNSGTHATTVIANPMNYIRLANGHVFTYSSGFLNATGYSTLYPNVNWIFAFGKSPYNLSPFTANPFTINFPSSPASYLYF